MDIGMLWFDNDPKCDLTSKIMKAAAYYKAKYGQEPNQCYVHPSVIRDAGFPSGEIHICTTPGMLPNHIWIGVELQEATTQ